MTSSFKMLEIAKGNNTLFLSVPTNTMNLWDLCAHSIILQEAGGVVTDFYGKEIDYSGSNEIERGVLASNKTSHEHLLQRLSRIYCPRRPQSPEFNPLYK